MRKRVKVALSFYRGYYLNRVESPTLNRGDEASKLPKATRGIRENTSKFAKRTRRFREETSKHAVRDGLEASASKSSLR